jgi:hypothetical protein
MTDGDQTPTTVVVPSWAKWLGKYVIGLLPVLFGFWLTVHDLQRDFVLEQEKAVTLTARVVSLEDAKAEATLTQVEIHTKLEADMAYTKEAVEKLNGTLERFLAR